MRIAILNWSLRRGGGAETYLSTVIPELIRAGHEVAFVYEVDEVSDREPIPLPDRVPTWCVSALGTQNVLAALRDWHPDLVYTHIIRSTDLEAEVLQIAPAVFFAHAYYGTCISGAKTFKNPIILPCSRRFGWQCLLHYYPHRCGGLSPVTMAQDYLRQSKRLKLLSAYKAVVANSGHMRSEYIKNGIAPDRVHAVPMPIRGQIGGPNRTVGLQQPAGLAPLSSDSAASSSSGESRRDDHWNLLFLGRMDLLKGGRMLLDALPHIRASQDRPLRVIFAGDGPDRSAWEDRAARIQAENSELQIAFVGWVGESHRDLLLAECDLLVVPSLWPEPFGLVGPEVGLSGVPVAAFAVGGIPDWLIDGVNGALAPGDPPTAEGLANAILQCLEDPSHHAQLRRGAVEMANRFNVQDHVSALVRIFENITQNDQI